MKFCVVKKEKDTNTATTSTINSKPNIIKSVMEGAVVLVSYN